MILRLLPEIIFATILGFLASQAHANELPRAEKFVCETVIHDATVDSSLVLDVKRVKVSLIPGRPAEIANLYGNVFYATLARGRTKSELLSISRMDSNSELRLLMSGFMLDAGVGISGIYEACADKSFITQYCMLDSKTVSSIACKRAN